MKKAIFYKGLVVFIVLGLGACTTTQQDLIRASQLSQGASLEQGRSDCMADQQMFHSHNSMLVPTAVEGAWVYCKRTSEIWYPGKKEPASEPAWAAPR